MQAKDLDALAAEVVQAMKMAMTPVLARVATLERDLKSANERSAELDALAIAPLVARITVLEGHKALVPRDVPDVKDLEQRILELETRPPVIGPAGPIGQKGDAGAGVATLVVSADGRLLAHLTDGRSLDAGPVPRGQKGDTGDRGDVGPMGPSGERGIAGEVGPVGPQGDRGLVGEKGQIGPQGDRGERGLVGDVGPIGPQGERGEIGLVSDAEIQPVIDAAVAKMISGIPTPRDGRDGKDGVDGVSVDPVVVEALVTSHVAKAVSALPAPRDGKDGRDIDPASLELVISAHVDKAIAKLPNPKDGTSVTVDDVAPLVAAEVTKAVAAIPVPVNGRDGLAGKDGSSVSIDDVVPLIVREIEQRVAAIPVPKDGAGFTGAVVNREGHLVLTLSNGTTQDVGLVIGNDGAPGVDGKDAVGTPGIDGKDGLDGLGFDDYDLTLDETRGWIFRLGQGDRVKEWILGLPFDAKVWAAGTTYPKGAGTTWDGHYWIAQAQTSEQPGEGSPAWRLAVRRGKQGREGKQGKDGSPGRDLTQMDPQTGRKW